MRLRAERVTWQRAGDEVIVLDITTSEYLSLNPSGAVLWERLAGADGADEHALAQALIECYDLPSARAAGDAAAFLATLRARELIDD